MKSRKLLLSVLSASLPAFAAAAEPGAPNPNPNPKPGAGAVGGPAQGAWNGKTAAEAYIAYIERVVQLSDEQKKAIVRIIEARDAAIKIYQGQVGGRLNEAQAAMLDAYKHKDREALAQAQKDYQELYAPIQKIMKDSQADLDAVPTPEQKEALKKAGVGARAGGGGAGGLVPRTEKPRQ